MKEQYKQIYANKLVNIYEMDKSLKIQTVETSRET